MKTMASPPILLVVFNRPDLTHASLDAIRKAKPGRLYIAADGPRPGNTKDVEACAETRRIIDRVDWDCTVKTLFRDSNLGCRVGVSSAIDWFFEHETEGIILEDDCIPAPSFFRYCDELLERYRSDERVMVISGSNFQRGSHVNTDSYYFSRYNHCWGWASWRRAWQHYDRDMSLWPAFKAEGRLDEWSDGKPGFVEYWTRIFNRAAAGEIDSWAYRWTFSCWAHNGLTCLPAVNLVSNIGFDDRATHTKSSGSWQAALQADELPFPLRHPAVVTRSITADQFTDQACFGIQPPRHPVMALWAISGRVARRILRHVRGLVRI